MTSTNKARLGFLGVGWIGRHRMQAVLESGAAEVTAIADASSTVLEEAAKTAPGARVCGSYEELLAADIDGIVIATPSAQHAAQAIAALEHGKAVFCQKPLARHANEARAVVEAAERANRLLGVDLSYRYTEGLRKIKALLDTGELGDVYTARLVFHNAYGPDKPWYYDRALAGGGCVMDLGIHLVDLALWLFGADGARVAHSRLYKRGVRLTAPVQDVEDYAIAQLDLAKGRTVELACSWRLPAGTDCVIQVDLFGADSGASFRNVSGSFYDFTAERMHGTSRDVLSTPPDAWGGRAAVDFARRLSAGAGFDAEARTHVVTASILDDLYALA